MSARIRVFSCALVLAGTAACATAGEELVPVRQSSVLVAALVDAAPTIDGKLDDPVWQKAQPLRHFGFRNKAVRYQTEGWLCRDAANFYFAARCFDDNLAGLVTAFEGRALWKNDCIELFVVPDKKELFYAHLIVTCDGRTHGSTWVPDEWGEPTRGKDLKLVAATGREPAGGASATVGGASLPRDPRRGDTPPAMSAWTMELSVPIAAFGHAITPASVWALGFCREKHSDPEEVSSFQGGFNRPREYPDLVFDDRTLVVDGLGFRNLGATEQKTTAVVLAGNARAELTRTLPPGGWVSAPWEGKGLKLPREGQEFETAIERDGKTIVRERYILVVPPKKEEPVDVSKIPPAKFAKTVLDDPSFFPVSVWLQPAGPAAAYKAMGVNVYVGGVDSYPRPKDREFLDAIQKQGMYAICPYKKQYVEEKLFEHPAFIGWMYGDEPDNVNAATGQVGRTPADLLADLARIRRDDPAHRVYLNLGCGVAHERFVGRGATDEQYADYPKACDIVSFDVYPCNSIEPDGPNRLHLVAKGIDRLRKWAGPEKKVWCWIEANKISKGEGRAPTPDEVKTQIWMTLVHGADGYGFFCHSWAGPQPSVAAISPEMQAALAPVNAEVHRLAPVLNSPTIADAATVKCSLDSRVDAMVKRHEGATYVFAVNMFRKPEKAAITLKGIADVQAEVLFEGRTIPVKGGVFTDDFAPYAVHRYRVSR
ncbi:MAG TPA: hypothetical protein PLE19_11425 [Planctomycetota bacterium]|nr:hypothetical protein [Planctomycetota bacterium]HRR81159.1 hypothetical protein [Planctomycetota bacterium]